MTLEEIARLAGVSRSTVSRVVNGDSRVSEQARQRVEAVIQKNNFYPNAAARSLASRRTRIIGLMIPQAVGVILSDPFYLNLIRGAVEAGNDTDYNLTILMETGDEGQSSSRVYQRVIRGRHVDGVVILSNVVEDPIIARLQSDRFPFVQVGRHPHHDVSFVDVDNRAAASEAVFHLIGHGYRRIGMINGPPNMIAAIDRYAGYVTALQESGRYPDPALTRYSDFTRRGAYRSMQELMATSSGCPDAVFVASDTMASGALQALRDGGMRIPDDIAIFGFDGLEEILISQPVLSTVIQPIADLGRQAVSSLINLLASPDLNPIQRYLPTRLSIRSSCGCKVEDVGLLAGAMAGGVAY